MLAILFLSIYFLSGTTSSELLKTGFLIQHYKAHRQTVPQHGFVTFLMNHYVSAHDDDGDSQDDMKLPFKACVHDFSSNQMIIQHLIYFKFQTQEVFPKPLKFIGAEIFLKSSYLAMIWQPPRIV